MYQRSFDCAEFTSMQLLNDLFLRLSILQVELGDPALVQSQDIFNAIFDLDFYSHGMGKLYRDFVATNEWRWCWKMTAGWGCLLQTQRLNECTEEVAKMAGMVMR